MNGKTLLVATALGSIMVSGCTSLNSKKLLDEDNTPQGLIYRLPAKQFSIKTVLEITECTPRGSDKADLKGKVSASVTESLIGAEAYTIDYQKLNAWTKVTNTEFQLSEAGLLTGVNASITDQSGAVISNSVAAATSIATAVASGGLSVPLGALSAISGAPQERNKACDPVNTLIQKKEGLEEDLKVEKNKDKKRAGLLNEIAKANLEIKALTNLAATYEMLGNEAERKSLLAGIKEHMKTIAETKSVLIQMDESRTDEITKELANAKSALTIVSSKDFVPAAGLDSEKVTIPTIEVSATSDDLKKVVGGALDLEKVTIPTIEFTVEPINEEGKNEAKFAPSSEIIGIAYRTPVAAIVKVSAKHSNANKELLLEKSTQVPQFGPIGSICTPSTQVGPMMLNC